MLFNSLAFAIFFPVVTVIYFVIPHRFRWIHLLVASCLFYMFFIPIYFLILAFTIVVDYCAGILIERAQGRTRLAYLIVSLISNIGVLAIFKYFNFVATNLTAAAAFFRLDYSIPLLQIILPIGLSFHTFQAMSYTIEVYKGRHQAERHFGLYALYVMFFPQLVAGPIERPQNLLGQLRKEHFFDYDRVTDGLKLMAWGLFKKVVIADRIAEIVDPAYSQPVDYSDIALLLATVLYAYQIYCDFSGYSDIAIGAAKVMGISLMINFRRPYYAKSIAEFWTRWHISLSTWFKDYLYIPLGGNRVGAWRFRRNVLVVFLISGLWHGANWTFIFWGGLHGFYLIASNVTAPARQWLVKRSGLINWPTLHGWLQAAITCALVCYSWIFFRALTVQQALYVAERSGEAIVRLPFYLAHLDTMRHSVSQLGWYPRDWLVLLSLIGILEIYQYFEEHGDVLNMYRSLPAGLRWAGYYALLLIICVFGQFGARQFIYFQF